MSPGPAMKGRHDQDDHDDRYRVPRQPEAAYRSGGRGHSRDAEGPAPPYEEPYTYRAYDGQGSKKDEYQFEDDKPMSRRRVWLAGLGQVCDLLPPKAVPTLPGS